MRGRQHEIPTHLNVEDKLVFGLTMRQFLYLLVGSSIAYSLWGQTASMPSVLHIGVPALCVLSALAMAVLRPFGRPLEELLLAGALYATTPRRSSWQVSEPDPADWRPAHGAWQELAPSIAWADESDEANRS